MNDSWKKKAESDFSYTAKETAIYYLSRRDHGEFELLRKLKQKGYLEEEIGAAIHFCLESNYLNDHRFAQSQVRQHIFKGHGTRRIRQELKQKRVSDHDIEAALESQEQDWFELAKEVALRKFKGKKAEDNKEYAKQIRFLQYRGFDFEQIQYALDDAE
ncbi:recombination regulator RecX [Vibrio sp.]|nr:recombination regulator RecX [Vibrio sp.]